MNFLKKNKFKILGISLCIIIFLGIFSKTLGVEAEEVNFKTGKVNVKCLNVRCGPGVQYDKIGKIYKDDYIEVFTQLGDWYVIKTEDDMVGTVFSKYIDPIVDSNKDNNINENQENSENMQNGVNQENIKESEESNQIAEQDDNTSEISVETIENETILNVSNMEFSDSSGLTEEEQEFLNLVNANRENNGLPKLEIDNEVQNIARLKAEDLVQNNYFSHISPVYGDMSAMLTDSNIKFKTVGENIAGNNNLTGAVEAWMNSENHRANLLSTDYNYTGVAIAESELYGKIFVQVFIGK